MIATLAFAALLAASGPTAPGPAPPDCDYCGMPVADLRFAAALDSHDGRAFRFDAIECLAAFTLRPTKPYLGPARLRVARFDRPDSLAEAGRAVFLESPRLASPMGLGLSAWPDSTRAAAARARHRGRLLDWNGVVALVRERWLSPRR